MPTPDTLCPECSSRLQAVAERRMPDIPAGAIVIGAVVLLLIAAALFFFLGRGPKSGETTVVVTSEEPKLIAPNEAPPQGSDEYLLRLVGSNTIGAKLAPDMAVAWLKSKGATVIDRKRRKSANGDEDLIVTARLDGKNVAIEIRPHGTGLAFSALKEGTADIGMASRPINDEEAASLTSLGDMRGQASEHVMALDALAIIVPQSSQAQALTKQDVRRIFMGRVTSWSAFGGPNRPIHLYARNDMSGTYDTFMATVMGDIPLAEAKRYEDSALLEREVADDPDGIGFVSLAAVKNARALAISDAGAAPLAPTSFTVKTENYPLSRRLYLYTAAQKKPAVREFIEFALSKAGQAAVKASGFVDLDLSGPVEQTAQDTRGACTLSAEWRGDRNAYCKLRDGAEQLGTSFRFRSGSAELDNRAVRDLRRVLERMEATPDKQLVLAGFADAQGAYQANCALSRSRGNSIANALGTLGIKPAEILGFCEELPVRDNETDTGREQNRRVEVFIR